MVAGKFDIAACEGFYSTELNIRQSFRQLDICSVFQDEVFGK